jgi:hypothetical protein
MRYQFVLGGAKFVYHLEIDRLSLDREEPIRGGADYCDFEGRQHEWASVFFE